MAGESGVSEKSVEFDARVLERLACPVCFGALRLESPDMQIICIECGRAYLLIDGIPVLIPERGSVTH